MVANKEMKSIMKSTQNSLGSIEQSGLKFLDTMGWLIQSLTRNDINLIEILTGLGQLHQSMGININHYAPMLSAMHETLEFYYPIKYRCDVCFVYLLLYSYKLIQSKQMFL